MANRWLRACCSAVLAGAMATGACTPSQQAVADAAFANPEVQGLLKQVPADTPFVWVGLEGSSRAFAEKMMKRSEPMLKQADAMLGLALSAGASSEAPEAKVLRAFGAELQGKLTLEGVQQLGFDLDARAVIYGLGVLPAMRVHMKDVTALRGTIDRVQAASGVQFPVANHNGQDYWHGGGGDKFEFVAAFVGNDFVAAMIVDAPGPQRDKALAVLFGQEAPERSLVDVPTLKDAIATHGLGQFSAGYFDVRGFTDALVGAGAGLNAETATAVMAGSKPTPECATEYQGLAGLMPRVVFGTTRLDEAGLETRVVAELRADLTTGLAAVRTKVPGLDGTTHKDVMFGMGSGVDVGLAVELALAQAKVVEAAPFKCAQLGWLNDAARSIVREAPEVPLPLRQLRGFAWALEDMSFLAGILPTNIRGYATVGTADPLALIKTVKSVAPSEMAFLPDLAEEGVPQRLNTAAFPVPLPIDPFIAGRRDAGLAITVGGEAERRAGALLVEQSEAKPLLVFHMNMGRLVKMLPGEFAGNPQMAMFDVLGSQGYVVDTSEAGVVMRSWMNFPE